MLRQIVGQQAEDLERRDEGAAFVGETGPIGVAVEEQAQVVPAAGQLRQGGVHVGRDRLRVHAAEVRVPLRVDLGDTDPAARQEPRDPARPRAVERIHQHVKVGGGQTIQIHVRADELHVAGVRVEALQQTRGLGFGEGPPGNRFARVGGQHCLDRGEHLGAGRRARGRLDLEAVVRPGVVAGSDDDSGRRLPLDDLERGHLRRHGLGRQRNRDRVRQDDFGGGGGEVLAHEAAVVGDDDPLGLLAALQHVFGHRPSTAADVVEREVLGYPCPPAVRPKDDPGRLRVG